MTLSSSNWMYFCKLAFEIFLSPLGINNVSMFNRNYWRNEIRWKTVKLNKIFAANEMFVSVKEHRYDFLPGSVCWFKTFFFLPKDTDNILHAARILLVLVAGYYPPPLQMGGLSLGKGLSLWKQAMFASLLYLSCSFVHGVYSQMSLQCPDLL